MNHPVAIDTQSNHYPPAGMVLWLFILAELLVFGAFFVSYAFTRMSQPEVFNLYQQTLDTDAAVINTLALITASYFVVRGIAAIKRNDAQIGSLWFWAAFAMGLVFLIVKTREFAHHIGEGISLSTNTFYMFYLSMTFFHYMHVIVGMMILTVVAIKADRGHYSANDHVGADAAASYWHMVDLVWLILFPLVYVMR